MLAKHHLMGPAYLSRAAVLAAESVGFAAAAAGTGDGKRSKATRRGASAGTSHCMGPLAVNVPEFWPLHTGPGAV